MNPFVLFLLAILSPLLLAATLLLPAYVGISAALYVIYDKPDTVHPLIQHFTNVFYIVDVYYNLLINWIETFDLSTLPVYSAPLLLFPLLGFVLSLWLTAKLSRKLMDIFQLGVHH